jgi:hypothetical protein
MVNNQYIKMHLQNHPFIMKSVLKMDDLDSINIKYVEHFVQIVENYAPKFKKFKLAYNNYTKFIDLYKTILEISGEYSVDIGFCGLSKIEKIKFLEINNIKHKLIDDIIAVYPSSFEEGQMIYPKIWCIKKSKKMWNSYNKNSQHVVFYRGDKIYGVSHSDTKFKCYSKKDIPISYRKFNKEIDCELPGSLKINRKINTKHIIKKYKKEFWVLLLILAINIAPILALFLLPYDMITSDLSQKLLLISLFSSMGVSLLNIMHCLYTDDKKILGIFIVFISIFPVHLSILHHVDVLKYRLDKIVAVDEPLTKKYQDDIIQTITKENMENIADLKSYLIKGGSPPGSYFSNQLVNLMKDDDYVAFDILIDKINIESSDFNVPLILAIKLNKKIFIKRMLMSDTIDSHTLGYRLSDATDLNQWEIAKMFVDHKNFNINDIFFYKLEKYVDDFEKLAIFYEYAIGKNDYNYKELLLKAIEGKNTLLTKTLLNDKHLQNLNYSNKYLEEALSLSNVDDRNSIVKLVFDNNIFDNSKYNTDIITIAILLDYDYIVEDFILNIDNTKNIDYKSIFKMLDLTKKFDIKEKLQQTEPVKEYF